MAAIKNILREELENSLAMEASYRRELEKLPRGSLVRKKVKGHDYYYLVDRIEGKVRFSYRGKSSLKEVEQYRRIKDDRAKYRKLLSQVKKQVKFLKGTLRGKAPI
jgi:hypothetical protein